ncbi:MAG: ribonuclease HII [bacterium]|nr:ribonuclease HII [Candidatus Sumerlaeota bacterium]
MSAGLYHIERGLHAQGLRLVAGIDEAGRGPLAGPVCAAAVVFEPGARIPGVNDSKKLSPARRETLYGAIMERALSVGVGLAAADEIDALNILKATKLAARRALQNLEFSPDCLLLDALRLENCPIPQQSIIRGDAKCFSIAAASIIAKVTRDRLMVRYDEEYPCYAFAKHKGYPTALHYERLAGHGISTLHRRTFFDPGFLSDKFVYSRSCADLRGRIGRASSGDELCLLLDEVNGPLASFLPRSEIVLLNSFFVRDCPPK